jgi:hypothetical protein
MAQRDKDQQTHNQPSHEAQVKGGQHSHQDSTSQSNRTTGGNTPSHEESVKDGQQSQQGGNQGAHTTRVLRT